MNQSDYEKFLEIMDGLGVVYGKSLPPNAIAVYWKLVQGISLRDFEKAINAHCNDPENGKFFPLVAHINAQLQHHDGRPSADECWPGIPRSEAESAYWTEEAKAAFFICLPLLEAGEEIAARMSFKGAYDAAVRRAREEHRPVKWEFSQGFDKHGRERVLREAMNRGLLSQERAVQLLPDLTIPDSASNLALLGDAAK